MEHYQLFMNVCQHMWVERCASEELYRFDLVGGILYSFISIFAEFVTSV